MTFPKIIYGKCPVCGGVGADDASSGSQHSTEDHEGTGYNLRYYKGRLMCQMCEKRIRNDDITAVKNAQYNAEQNFLDGMGVKKEMD